MLPSPTGYVVWCPDCPSEREYVSELAAERALIEHDRGDQRAAETKAILERVRTLPTPALHIRHTAACTQEVCGPVLYFCTGPMCHVAGTAGETCSGHSLMSRAELTARSSARHQKR